MLLYSTLEGNDEYQFQTPVSHSTSVPHPFPISSFFFYRSFLNHILYNLYIILIYLYTTLTISCNNCVKYIK